MELQKVRRSKTHGAKRRKEKWEIRDVTANLAHKEKEVTGKLKSG